MKCPCHSGKEYEECCQTYHEGELAPDALHLMRSRYCAYAMRLPKYIIETTHRDNPSYNPDHDHWEKEIMEFSDNTQFEDLEIDAFEDNEVSASVTFHATLTSSGNDASFSEKSDFALVDGQWLYKGGKILD